jgi:hypothetical protein
MFRKVLISTILLFAFLPANSWAISNVNYNLSGYAHGNAISNFWSSGNVSGSWNGSSLSGISGYLSGNNGSININGGSLAANGSGSLDLSIKRYNGTYTGTISFLDSGYYGGWYDNSVSADYLNLWGGDKLSYTWTANGSNHSYNFGKWWVSLDLNGEGTTVATVPEPATFGLMGLGMLGFAFARKKQNQI